MGVILVSFSGMVTGAVSAYIIRIAEPYSPGLLALGAIGGAFILTGSWLLASFFLARIAGEDSEAALAKSSLPFAAAALIPFLQLPFIWYQGRRIIQAADYALLTPKWQLIIILACSVGLIYGLLAVRYPLLRRGPFSAITNRPVITISLMMLFFIGITSTMDILRTYYMHDAAAPAVLTEALNNIFSEKGPLYTNYIQIDGSSLLGLHGSFIWYLVYPFFLIWPSYEWLLILTKIALALAAIPIFYLSRKHFGTGISLLLVAIYLFNGTIISQAGAGHVSEEDFLPVLFISAFYFWHSKRFLLFLLFALLALTVREDIGVVLALLGALSLFKRYSLKWWLIPSATGITWFLIMSFWVVPHFNPSGYIRAFALFGDLGESDSGLFSSLLSEPWTFFQTIIFTENHLAFIYELVLSLGFGIPLLSSVFILALPAIFEILLLNDPNISHYNAVTITATLFPALILGLANINKFSLKRWNVKTALPITLAVLFISISLVTTWYSPAKFRPRYNYETAISMLDSIPEGSSVIAPRYMVYRAGAKYQINGYIQAYYIDLEETKLHLDQDYLIIDAQETPENRQNQRYYKGLALIRKKLETSEEYVKVRDENDLQLFMRRTES